MDKPQIETRQCDLICFPPEQADTLHQEYMWSCTVPFGGLKVKGSSLNILPDRTCWNSSETREVNQRLPGFKMNIICFRLSPLVTNILFFSIVCILNLHLKVSTTKLYLILNCIVDLFFLATTFSKFLWTYILSYLSFFFNYWWQTKPPIFTSHSFTLLLGR